MGGIRGFSSTLSIGLKLIALLVLREVLVQWGLHMESWKMLYQRKKKEEKEERRKKVKEAKTKYGWKFSHFFHFNTRIRYRIDRYNHSDKVIISRMHMWY